ncbi:glycosyltransferase [Rhodothermus marinus]|uniref:Glycosyl transferase family 2 n=1 Tax=Rhodothermus marinus (strain ATCC 43812 / DSM 4252 / R-10) TaxID=518766 RepID=D0MDD3_RHOM4|nr:glycosyltransferase [Rhodothermus marinus]ACY47126.1 glycosyl transferase family 2 [Rhodothermus marinus DSM 4252]
MSCASSISAPADPVTPESCDLSVIIVNYNVRDLLEQALRSVFRAADGLELEVFVVDNNSVDGSVEMVRAHFPEVHLIANTENVGFSRANNQAIRRARGRYLLLLNPDTIVQEDTLRAMVDFLDAHPEVGAAGCKILNPDGSFAPESRRSFPTPAVAFYRMVGLSRLFPHSRRFGRYNLTYLSPEVETEVDALSGSCMFVRHAALYFSRMAYERLCREGLGPTAHLLPNGLQPDGGAGLLDEDFFMYGEDLDWCYRIQQAGWKIVYTPRTQIIHYKGESTKKGELRYVRLFYGAMLRFVEKHFRDRYSPTFLTLLRLGIALRAGLSALHRGARRLAPLVIDGLLTALIVTLGGWLRSLAAGRPLAALFLLSVVPAYALSTVAGIALMGGYRRGRIWQLRPVFYGTLIGLLFMGTLSFLVPDIAFSRMVVLLSAPFALAALLGWRLVWRRRHAARLQRALLVGPTDEARRLHRLLEAAPWPSFQLIGYVSPEPDGTDQETPPRLGALHHLRDLVRLRQVDAVIFATAGLSHTTVLQLIQQLRDLPVQFKILPEGRPHVIGKAHIETLEPPSLVDAEAALPTLRSLPLGRALECGLALVGLILRPLLKGMARLSARPGLRQLVRRLDGLPDVLRGRRTLVGCHPDECALLPEGWGIRPGLFAVSEARPTPPRTPEDIRQLYAYYMQQRTAWLELRLLLQAIRRLLQTT